MWELTAKELQKWSGAVHFLSLFPVFKASSVLIKLRIFSNSALVHSLSGLSMNDCLWSGPAALADLLAIVLHWRMVEVALMMVILKANHAINTRKDKLHLQRFLHRKSPAELWRICSQRCTTIGDMPAGLMLEVAKKRALHLYGIFDTSSNLIKKNNEVLTINFKVILRFIIGSLVLLPMIEIVFCLFF